MTWSKMSDPLADLQDDVPVVKPKFSRDSRSNPPDFKKGDILELKEYAGRFDLLWQVVVVYWAGVEPNQYWMVHAHLIGNDKANIWAPHWNFVKYEKKQTLPGVSVLEEAHRMLQEVRILREAIEHPCLVCGGKHGNLPCPNMTVIAKENVNENTRGNTSSSSSSGIGNENTVGDPLLSLLEDE